MRRSCFPLSRTAGEGAERSEAGEGYSAATPSPTARYRERSPLSRRAGEGFTAALLVCALSFSSPGARADEVAAVYDAFWAGVTAGQIRLTLYDEPNAYRDRIDIRSEGVPRIVTRFRGSATSEGRLAGKGLPAPARYEADYDLRKRRDRRLVMIFAARAGSTVAERGPADTSRKPPLAEQFRTNVIDPLSALTAIRDELRRGNRGSFAIPVYDGARRFDVRVQVKPKRAGTTTLDLELTLVPIAGFKGETSDDGDPDTAPRPVSLTLTDDARLMPLSMSVSIYYLPLVVQLSRWCAPAASCSW